MVNTSIKKNMRLIRVQFSAIFINYHVVPMHNGFMTTWIFFEQYFQYRFHALIKFMSTGAVIRKYVAFGTVSDTLITTI